MRLYLDTSALVKLYVEEDGRPLVTKSVEEADSAATSLVAYVEARAAFALRRREGILLAADHNRVLRDFENDWRTFFIIDVTGPLVKNAGKLAERHALRAYDAVHLASADFFQSTLEEAVTFASWDSRLETAAQRQGLSILRSRLRSLGR